MQVPGREVPGLPGTVAALHPAHPGTGRVDLRGRLRVRRLEHPRVAAHPRVGHAGGPRSRHRSDRPVPEGADPPPDRQHLRPDHQGTLQPRPPPHRDEGRGVPQEHRAGRHGLLRARGRVLHLRRGPLRPDPQQRLLPGGFRRRPLEHGPRRAAQPRVQAPLQGGLLPRSPDRQPQRSAQRDGSGTDEGRHPRGAPTPRGGDGRPGRDRHPLRAARAAGRQPPVVQVHPEERGPPQRQDDHVHAQAPLRGQRVRDARAPVHLEEGQEHLRRRTSTGGSPRRPSGTSAASSSTRPPCAPSATPPPTRTSAWSRATRRR